MTAKKHEETAEDDQARQRTVLTGASSSSPAAAKPATDPNQVAGKIGPHGTPSKRDCAKKQQRPRAESKPRPNQRPIQIRDHEMPRLPRRSLLAPLRFRSNVVNVVARAKGALAPSALDHSVRHVTPLV